MPDSPAPVFALPDYGVIDVEGADAVAFCHAQFASDVTALTEGHWHWSAWLTPKGRVIALFALAKVAADRVVLAVPDAPVEPLAQAMQRFVFRRKAKVSAGRWHVAGRLEAPLHALAARNAVGTRTAPDVLELDFSGSALARSLLLRSAPADAAPQLASRWREADLRHGLPRLEATQRERWTPQQLSLERLQAYSVSKGCYPGQEIVARTHFLGKSKRGLRLFQSAAAVAPGDMLVSAGGDAMGEVVSFHAADSRLLLAVLPLDMADEAVHAPDGTRLTPLPLEDGLAR